MTDLIPRTVLFGNPERTLPELSPDGRQLAWIAPLAGVLNVWVAPLGRRQGGRLGCRTGGHGQRGPGYSDVYWAHDGRHLLYIQDTGGDENWRLYNINLETMQRRDLTPFDGVQASIIAADPKFPTEILVGLNRDNPNCTTCTGSISSPAG